MLIGSELESVLWEQFSKYVSVLDKKNVRGGTGCMGLTSNAFNKFVKELRVLEGVKAAGGKSDSIFREIVHAREREFARVHSRSEGANIRSLGGGRGVTANKVSRAKRSEAERSEAKRSEARRATEIKH